MAPDERRHQHNQDCRGGIRANHVSVLLKVRAMGLDIARAHAKTLLSNGLRAGAVVAARGGDRRVVAVGRQVWLPMVTRG